jgi:hypothetical protein
MRRFLELVLIALASFRLIGWLQAVTGALRQRVAPGTFLASLVPMREATYITGDEKITKFITTSPVMLAALICFMGIYAAFRIATMEGEQAAGKVPFDISKHREWIWRWTVRAAVLVIWAVLLLVIDGRQASSLGATYADMITVLMEYKAINAVNMDGGSSSLMYYKGEYLNKGVILTGDRDIPDGFIVR